MKRFCVYLVLLMLSLSVVINISAETAQELQQRIEELTTIIKQDQNNRDAYFQRGQAYFALKQYQRAVPNYVRVIELDPEYMPAYRDLALASISLGDTKNAFQLLDKALELAPNDGLNYFHRGMLFRKTGQASEAVQDFMRSGENFRKGKNYKDSLQAYTVAIKLAPQEAAAYIARGKVLNLMKNYTDAIQDFGKAIALDAAASSAYYNRGASLYRLEKFAEALRDYTQVTQLKPNDDGGHFNRGLTHVKLAKPAEAIDDFSAVLALKPDHHWAYYNRAKLYAQLGQNKEAAADYNAYLKLRAGKDNDAEKIRQKIRDLGFTPEF